MKNAKAINHLANQHIKNISIAKILLYCQVEKVLKIKQIIILLVANNWNWISRFPRKIRT